MSYVAAPGSIRYNPQQNAMIYSLGIDISKDKFDTCLQSYSLDKQTHTIIARKSFNNTPSGFTSCMKWAAGRTPSGATMRATMEATGTYYEPLALFIGEQCPNIHLAVVLPSKSKQYFQSHGLRSKTDKIDARGLALMGAERQLAAWDPVDPFWRELRAVTRTRTRLQDQKTALRNQLHALGHGGMEAPQAKASLQAAIDALKGEIRQLTNTIYGKLRSRKRKPNTSTVFLALAG